MLWIHLTSSCSTNADVNNVQSTVANVQATWKQCSQNRFTFDANNRWVVNVDIGCPNNCDASLEEARNRGLNVRHIGYCIDVGAHMHMMFLGFVCCGGAKPTTSMGAQTTHQSVVNTNKAPVQAARSQGIDPNTFPYHAFFWPKWVNDNCWAGIAQIGWCVPWLCLAMHT